MKKVVVSGYYGFNNIGDDAMIETFSKYFLENDVDATFLSKNPEQTNKKYNVKSVNRDKLGQIIKTIKNSDILISGGGTLLQDITKVISIWYYLIIILIGLIYKKQVYILFQGIGPINNKFNIWLTKKILKKVNYIILRDQKAFDEMKRLGFDTTKTIVATDVVFAMQMPTVENNIKLIQKYIQDYNQEYKYIGVSLRPWKEYSDIEKFAKLLDEVSKKYNAKIVFFPFHKSQDYDLSVKVKEKMKEKSHIIFDDLLPSELAGMMSLMYLNIGVRLHSLVFSVIGKVPVAGISYDPKVDGFLKEFDLEPICRYENFEIEETIKNIDKEINKNVNEKISKKVDENKLLVIEILNKLMEGKYE